MSQIEPCPAPILPTGIADPFKSEQHAFHRLLPGLPRSHGGLFVAIFQGQLVESGEDKAAVARRAYARFGYVPILVTRVTEEPPAPARLPSPRAARGGSSS